MYKPKNTRLAKTIVSSILGLSLVVGGSTYALWSATDTSTTGSSITTGDLQVTASTPQNWFDVSDSNNPTEITDLTKYRLTPGDTIKLRQDLNVVVVGDNISGIIEAKIPNQTLSAALMGQAKFTLSLFNKDDLLLGSITPTTNTSDSLALEVGELPRTAAEGEAYRIELSVELPSSSDNTTATQTISLDDMQITLRQGPSLLEKPAFVAASTTKLVFQKTASVKLIESPTSDPATLSLVSGAIPTGTSLSGDSMVGIPTTVGDYAFNLNARNSAFSINKDFTMSVDYTDVAGWEAVTTTPAGLMASYSSLASTPDGSTILAAADTIVYSSHDFGQTWSSHSSVGREKALAVSPSGQNIISGGYTPTNDSRYSYKYLESSFNGGSTWGPWSDQGILANGLITPKCRAVNVSYDAKLSVVGCANHIIVSETDSGGKEFSQASGDYVTSIAASAPNIARNGRWVAFTIQNGTVYKSTVVSGSWTTPTIVSGARAGALVMATPAGILYTAALDGTIYKNSTTLVSNNTQHWTYMKAVTDTKFLAIADGKIYTSKDAGVTWKEQASPRSDFGVKYATISENGTIYATTDGPNSNYLFTANLTW